MKSFPVPGLLASIALSCFIAWDQSHRPASIHQAIDQGLRPRWGDYFPILKREHPQARYLGRIHVFQGGCDVYDCSPHGWRLVGPGRRFTPCTADDVVKVSDALIARLSEESPPFVMPVLPHEEELSPAIKRERDEAAPADALART